MYLYFPAMSAVYACTEGRTAKSPRNPSNAAAAAANAPFPSEMTVFSAVTPEKPPSAEKRKYPPLHHGAAYVSPPAEAAAQSYFSKGSAISATNPQSPPKEIMSGILPSASAFAALSGVCAVIITKSPSFFLSNVFAALCRKDAREPFPPSNPSMCHSRKTPLYPTGNAASERVSAG